MANGTESKMDVYAVCNQLNFPPYLFTRLDGSLVDESSIEIVDFRGLNIALIDRGAVIANQNGEIKRRFVLAALSEKNTDVRNASVEIFERSSEEHKIIRDGMRYSRILDGTSEEAKEAKEIAVTETWYKRLIELEGDPVSNLLVVGTKLVPLISGYAGFGLYAIRYTNHKGQVCREIFRDDVPLTHVFCASLTTFKAVKPPSKYQKAKIRLENAKMLVGDVYKGARDTLGL